MPGIPFHAVWQGLKEGVGVGVITTTSIVVASYCIIRSDQECNALAIQDTDIIPVIIIGACTLGMITGLYTGVSAFNNEL